MPPPPNRHSIFNSKEIVVRTERFRASFGRVDSILLGIGNEDLKLPLECNDVCLEECNDNSVYLQSRRS